MGPDEENKQAPLEPVVAPVFNAPEPVAQPEAAPVAPAQPTVVLPVKKSKKTLLIVLISLGVVLLLAAAAVALVLWWTSPAKSFEDSINQTVNSSASGAIKGSMVVVPKSGPEVTIEYTVKVDGVKTNSDLAFKVNAGAINVNLTGSIATDENKNVYFKINDVKKTVDAFAGESSAAIEEYYGTLINKIDGKWVQMTPSDLKEVAGSSGADLSCVADTFGKLSTDASYLDEIVKISKENSYIKMDKSLGSEVVNGKDSNHMSVTVDKSKLDSAGTALTKSKLFTDLEKCGLKSSSDSSSADTASKTADVPKMEIWVDKWSHKMTKMTMSQNQDGNSVNLTMLPDYTKQTVTAPKAETQFKDLQAEVKSLEEQFAPSDVYLNEDGTTTSF